jgi:hypothetical protein
VIAPAVRTILTVTVTAEEVKVTGIEELSFTWSSKCHVPEVDKVPVELVGVLPALQTNAEPKPL